MFENFFKDSSIYGKGTKPKLAHLVQLWPLFSSWRWPKSKKISSRAEKPHPFSSPNMSNEVFMSSPLSGKNAITFCNNWDIFIRNQDGVTIQRDRIKIWQITFNSHDSWSTSCQKILVQIFSSFAAIDHNGHFRKILTEFSNLACFLGTIPKTFFKSFT